MIIQIFNAQDRVVKIKVIQKEVYYSDSINYPNYIPFLHLLKNKNAVADWNNRLKELKTEKEIADEILYDMKRLGYKLIKEIADEKISMD